MKCRMTFTFVVLIIVLANKSAFAQSKVDSIVASSTKTFSASDSVKNEKSGIKRKKYKAPIIDQANPGNHYLTNEEIKRMPVSNINQLVESNAAFIKW